MKLDQVGKYIIANWKPLAALLVAIIVVYIVFKKSKAVSQQGLASGLFPNIFGQGHNPGLASTDPSLCNNIQGLTYNAAWYANACDQIESAFFGQFLYTEDEETVINVMKQCQKDADVQKMICVFGYRERWDGGTLPVLIQNYLSDSDKQEINDDYASKGITHRFN